MIRLEIMINQSVESDLMEALEEAAPGFFYSRVLMLMGRGRQGHRLNDDVWPERNSLILIYEEDEAAARAMMAAVKDLKERFPREGIKLFVSEAAEWV